MRNHIEMSNHEVRSRSSPILLQHVLLVTLSILFLPASLLALFYNYGALALTPQDGLRRHVQRSARFKSRRIVITGISTPAGLRVARALHATGHNIVGVEENGYAILNYARWSKAVSKFYPISSPNGVNGNSKWAELLFRLIVRERASIWIDCSNGEAAEALAQTKRLVEERTTCVCFVPSLDQIRQFETRHGFQQLAQQLGLPSPELFSVHSRHAIYNILNGSNGKRYMLTSPKKSSEPTMRTILPRGTVSQTYQDLSRMKLSKSTPWTLEQYTGGLPQFTACAVVVQGTLKAFAASAVSDKGDYKAVPAKSGLSEAMKQYMESFAKAVGSSLSSHLTMEFCLDEKATHSGVVQQILPLSGHLTPHESLLLFEGKRGSIDLTKAYMSILAATTTEIESYTGLPYGDSISDTILPVEPENGVYFLHNDLKGLVVEPLVQLVTFRSDILSVVRTWVTFLQHLTAWQEALYEFSDPLPLFWYVHVSAPCHLVLEGVRKLWFRKGSLHRGSSREKHDRKEVQNGN